MPSDLPDNVPPEDGLGEPSADDTESAAAKRMRTDTKEFGGRARRLLRAVHRDAGFLAVGLTLVYAVSGFAVNHREDFDSDFRERTSVRDVGLPSALLGHEHPRTELTPEEQKRLGEEVASRLGLPTPENAFYRNARTFTVFFGQGERNVVDYDPVSGRAQHRVRTERMPFRTLNYLHLNEGPRAWTFVADGYAVLLAFLALSGLFMVRGRRALLGTGWVWLALGIAVPLLGLALR
jgi:hypothetical protein